MTGLDGFVTRVEEVTAHSDDEHVITATVADALRDLLAEGFTLPESHMAAHPDHYVMYPVYVDPQERFSIAAAVWNVGQSTPVHGHETWGVVGIYQGIEHEYRYFKPKHPGEPLQRKEADLSWTPGSVTVCCTTDDDIHEVACGSDIPCIGIHVYGTNIGTLNRRKYDAVTGEVGWFVSTWAEPVEGE